MQNFSQIAVESQYISNQHFAMYHDSIKSGDNIVHPVKVKYAAEYEICLRTLRGGFWQIVVKWEPTIKACENIENFSLKISGKISKANHYYFNSHSNTGGFGLLVLPLLVCNLSSRQSLTLKLGGAVILSQLRFPFEKRQKYLLDYITSLLIFLSFLVIFPPFETHHHSVRTMTSVAEKM